MTEIETPGVPEEDEKAGGITTLHARLRQLILDGVYPPGARLSERDLAQTFGVSRTPLREVLRMLAARGIGGGRQVSARAGRAVGSGGAGYALCRDGSSWKRWAWP